MVLYLSVALLCYIGVCLSHLFYCFIFLEKKCTLLVCIQGISKDGELCLFFYHCVDAIEMATILSVIFSAHFFFQLQIR